MAYAEAAGLPAVNGLYASFAAEPVTDIDLTAAEVLQTLHANLAAQNIAFCFAEMKGPVKDSLKRYGMFDMIREDRVFPTIGEAVSRYLESHDDVNWRDWEDA